LNVNGFFVALWLISAWLFRKAAVADETWHPLNSNT
jgi:hypothetical protein